MIFWLCFLPAVIADQAIKYLVTSSMYVGQSIPVIRGLFHISYVLNDGAAFSILQGQRWFFVVITLVVIAVLLWFLRSVPKDDRLMRAALGLFAGGTVGNFLDRLRLGAVTDYLDFRVFPVFNLADSCIVVGVIVLSLLLLIRDSRQSSHKPAAIKDGESAEREV